MMPWFGFFIILSACSQEHCQCDASNTTAKLTVLGKVLSRACVAWVLSSCIIFFCCLKWFHKICIHTVSGSKSVCFTSVENGCVKSNESSYRKGELYLFIKSPNKLPSYVHSHLYFIHSSFPPYPQKPQGAGVKVVRLTFE